MMYTFTNLHGFIRDIRVTAKISVCGMHNIEINSLEYSSPYQQFHIRLPLCAASSYRLVALALSHCQ